MIFLVKTVEKCKQRSILTSKQNNYKCPYYQKAKETKDDSSNCPMTNVFRKYNRTPKIKLFSEIKIKVFLRKNVTK
jgi:hypothetical protein